MDANKTRATESDYSTKFVEGDAIGVFAVRNEAIVGEINNRKFTRMVFGHWMTVVMRLNTKVLNFRE